ncbi:MAG: hypothetical protein CBD18_03905 [Opitutales bacterium TMED158]|nr:MAG: hypothetical protein CBD18_03905 [Opitutales bacterium TMED158]
MRLLVISQAVLVSFVAVSGAERPAILEENFEPANRTHISETLEGDRLMKVVPNEGVEGSHALRATYEGYERGSHRLTDRFELGERGLEYTLNYDVKFDENFQFVKGGKLHGLGPDQPITGGKAMRPDGWSARVTFKEEGTVRSYLYCQNKDGKYGTSISNPTFHFEKGRYYAISLHVKLNEDANAATGFARIYIDGRPVIRHERIRFRGEVGEETLISKFLFSTFHGGHEPHWAPRDERGDYADVHAYFDNIAVYRGRRVRSEPGD